MRLRRMFDAVPAALDVAVDRLGHLLGVLGVNRDTLGCSNMTQVLVLIALVPSVSGSGTGVARTSASG
jgi:hypothetical protein